ncbi:MAG: ParM/StbA family protein [Conexivisphaerales archaeon]
MEKILSIDNGYGYVKTALLEEGKSKVHKTIFPSLVDHISHPYTIIKDTSAFLDPLGKGEIDKHIFFSTKEFPSFSVGRGASAEFSFALESELIRPLSIVKPLFLSALAINSLKYSVFQAPVIYITPIGMAETERERLSSHFVGKHNITVNGIISKNITFNVPSVYFVEQGIASFIDVLYSFKDNGDLQSREINGRTLVLDIGVNTLNIAVLENLRLLYRETFPKLGTYKFIEDLLSLLKSKGIVLTKSEIQDMMQTWTFIVKRISPETLQEEELDLTEFANSEKKKVFKSIIEPRIKTILTDFQVKNVVLTGGGAKLFNISPNFIIPEDPQFSNSIGALKMYILFSNTLESSKKKGKEPNDIP